MEMSHRWADVRNACKENVNNAVRMKTPALVLVVYHPAHTSSRTLGESPIAHPLSRGHDSHRGRGTLCASAPACPRCPMRRRAPRRGVVPTQQTSCRALPAPTSPREPSPQAAQPPLHSRGPSPPTTARHSLADTCCPTVHEHHPASALTALYTSRLRIRVGT